MQIESSFTIAEAERIIREMEGRGTDTTVALPTQSRANVGGGEPAVAQALLTWARGQATARATTYATDAEDRQLLTLSRHLVGTCAGLICDEALDLHGRNVTRRLHGLALEKLEGLQSQAPQNWSRGAQLEIVCADHLGRSTPEMLYSTELPGQPLKSRQEFDRVVDLILAETVPERLVRRTDETLRGALIDAIYELFRNTDQYARTDEHGNSAGRSLRGLHARRQAVSRPSLTRMVEASPPLAALCERLAPRENRRDIQLLEISVFDTGPGYAPHWLGRPLDEIGREEELEAIGTCFEKHATRTQSSTAGIGLCTVVDVLRRGNGFMRLRTGRQSLYADLGLESDLPYGTPPKLRPWRAFRLPPAAGTLFTFILPL